MNNDATPAIQGFDGSEMITSYCERESIRCRRPSSTIKRVRGSASARDSPGEQARCFDNLRRNLDHIGSRDGMRECCAQRDAAAQTHDGHPTRLRMQQQRQVCEQPLSEHVRPVRRVNFPSIERIVAKRFTHRNRGGGAFAIVEKPTGGEPCLQIDRPSSGVYL